MTIKTIILAFDLPKLNYCDGLLYGMPQFVMYRQLKVQIYAARVIIQARKWDHFNKTKQTLSIYLHDKEELFSILSNLHNNLFRKDLPKIAHP